MDDFALNNVNIIIADDHSIFRDGLRSVLRKINFVKKITICANGQEVIDTLQQEQYDIVLMDVQMPVLDGLAASRIIRDRFPQTKVIVLTMFISRSSVLELYDTGVMGYLIKNTGLPELTKAITQVSKDEQYFCKEATEILYESLLKRNRNTYENRSSVKITSRESEVLKLICDQYSTEEIAEKLFLSPKTIKRHRQILFDKTNSKNLAGLVVYAIKKGIYKVYTE